MYCILLVAAFISKTITILFFEGKGTVPRNFINCPILAEGYHNTNKRLGLTKNPKTKALKQFKNNPSKCLYSVKQVKASKIVQKPTGLQETGGLLYNKATNHQFLWDLREIRENTIYTSSTQVARPSAKPLPSQYA